VTLTVAEDVESARTAIDGFVASFNAVLGTIDNQVRFDAETGQAGVLLGNRSIISIQDDIRNAVLRTVAGVTGSTNRLSSIGISFDVKGQLTVDTSRLDDVLNGRVDDVTLDDVRRLFSLSGESTKAGIEFLGGSTRTKDSASAIAVDISQAAERAVITATSDLAASTLIDSSNNSFTVSIDSQTSASLTLADGTYTRQELADHLESAINGDSTLIGREVSVSFSGNALQITSLVYGTSSRVSSVSGTATSSLGFVGTESDQGQDVVGKFIVNGVDEIAVGTGRLLIGDADNENTADLQLRVTLATSQVQSGVDGNITVTRGLAAKLDLVLNSILDPATGRVKTVNDSFDEQIQDIEETIARQNALVEQRQQSLIEEFIALETAISEFRSVGNFLAAQLAGLSGLQS
jgi:flagellar hook-associated protein 2